MTERTLVDRLRTTFIQGTSQTPPGMSRRERVWIGARTIVFFWLVIHEAGMYSVEVQQHDGFGMVLRALLGASFLWWGVEGVVRIDRSVIVGGRTSNIQDRR